MTDRQKLEIRSSEIRQRLNEIAGLEGDGLTDEVRAESDQLTTEYRDVETRLRAAIAAEQTEERTEEIDAEERERRELRGRSALHRFVGSAITGAAVDGAEAEYAAAEGCPGLVPLTMFGPTTEQRAALHTRAVEQRAVTEAPADSDVPHRHAPIVPALFDRSVAAFLGVEMPTVGTGIASYPVLSTSLQGGMKGESKAAAEGAGAFTVTDADPRRLTGAFRIRREDIAKLPGLEESLRENIGAVLSDELDKQVVNGNGTAPNLNGLLQQLDNPDAPATGQEDYARYQAALSSHIDGLFATMPGDVRALVGVETLRHMLGIYRANEDAATAYDLATTRYGGVRATRRLATAAVQNAIIRRANPAGDRVAVAPVWMGLELIRDPYTAAGKGEIVVTATSLVGGVVLLRSGAFVQDSFRVAA